MTVFIQLASLYEIATKDFPRINKNDSLYNAIKIMNKHGIDRVLVYDDEKAVGIITRKDIISRLANTRRKRFPPSTLHVSSVMSYPLIIMPANVLLSKAARVMIDKNISSIPGSEGDEIVALLTKWDIAKALKEDTTPLEQIMTSSVTTIYETDSLIQARRLMLDEGLSSLPVVSNEGKLVGIFTVEELCKALIELIDALSESGSRNALRRISVGEVMRPWVPALYPTDAVGMAAALMIDKECRAVAVISEGGSLVGIVTLTDLVKHIVNLQS